MQPMNIPGFMPMAPMRKDNTQDMMQGILRAAMSRGSTPGATPAAPAQGATLPGGAMNLVPPNPASMGLLGRLMRGMQPGAPMVEPMSSENAIY